MSHLIAPVAILPGDEDPVRGRNDGNRAPPHDNLPAVGVASRSSASQGFRRHWGAVEVASPRCKAATVIVHSLRLTAPDAVDSHGEDRRHHRTVPQCRRAD